MKFGKTYSEFIEKEASVQLAGCSYVKFKKLKKVLKKCTMHDASMTGDVVNMSISSCSSSLSCCEDSRGCTKPGFKARSSILTKKKQRKSSPVSLLTTGVCPTSCPGTLIVLDLACTLKHHLNPIYSIIGQYVCQDLLCDRGRMLDVHIHIDIDGHRDYRYLVVDTKFIAKILHNLWFHCYTEFSPFGKGPEWAVQTES